jgi:hypothetical protein
LLACEYSLFHANIGKQTYSLICKHDLVKSVNE